MEKSEGLGPPFGSPQIVREQAEQAFPMPFSIGLAVGRPPREGEAVVRTLVEFDLSIHACVVHRLAERLQLGHRRVVVELGPGDLDLALGLARGDVGLLGSSAISFTP